MSDMDSGPEAEFKFGCCCCMLRDFLALFANLGSGYFLSFVASQKGFVFSFGSLSKNPDQVVALVE